MIHLPERLKINELAALPIGDWRALFNCGPILRSTGATMHTLLQDLRYSLRQLIHSPGFALAAIVSIALGISATVAVFSVVWAVLMNPYPYASPDRMVHMKLRDKGGQEQYFGLTGQQWQVIRQSPVVEDAFMPA